MSGRASAVLIGVDAGDKDLILQWAEAGLLPSFRSALKRGLSGVITNPPGLFVGSVWPSFYTGVLPGKHGWYCFEQLRPGTYDLYHTEPGSFVSRDPFWRDLSGAGRKVAILDLPHPFPGAVNGIQLGAWGAHDAGNGPVSWPPSLAREVVGRFGRHPVPGRCNAVRGPMELKVLGEQLLLGVGQRADMTEHFLQREDWDFFASVFSESHCVGHHSWHLHDPTHPGYDQRVARLVGDPVKDVYVAIDAAIGRLLAHTDSETVSIIVCSHGMGPHNDGTFLLDDILRGLEHPEAVKVRGGLRGLWERGRSRALSVRHRGYTGPPREHDRADRPCFQVPNDTYAAAIRVNLVGREPKGKVSPGREYEEFCSLLTRDLLDLVNADTGEPLVREVLRAADLYEGEYMDHLPDLIVEWNRRKPISSVYSPKFGVIQKEYRGVRTGDHKPDGLFVALGRSIPPGRLERPVSITDFAPTIASLLGVPFPEVDGKPIEALLKQCSL